MKKKIWFILLVALALTACSKDKRAKIPSDVIPPEQMVLVLVDFHLVEASLAKAGQEGRDVDFLKEHYYYSVLKKNHITYKKFDESLKFYSANLKELHLIYKDVITELSKTQSRLVSKNL